MALTKAQTKKLAQAIQNEFESFIGDLGKLTQEEAVKLCPEDTGELKKSAYTQYKGTKKKLRGWSVVFDAPYAASVEEGRVSSGIPNYDMKVKRHKRRLASGKTVNVKAHVKKYSDFNKPVLIGGNEWRIVQDTDRPGVHFLRDAWKNVRNRVKDRKLRKMLPKTLNKEMIK